MIMLTDGVPAFLGGNEFTATISADSIPASQWVTVEVPVTADPMFDVTQVMMTPHVPGSIGSGPLGTPTPVQTDSMYLDNVYFSNGNDVAEPAFEPLDGREITFAADELEGFDITSFGAATAEVKASPNGDQALEVVKPDGAETWAGVTMWYPAAADQMSLVTAEHHDVVLNVYAPAAGETVRLKLENDADGTKFVETDVVTTTAGWQTVRFDFSDQIDPAVVYDKASVFPSFGDTGTGQTYFFDDALFLDAVPEFVIPTVNVALGMNGFNFTVDGEVGGELFLEPGYQYVLDTSPLGGMEANFLFSTTPDGTHNGGTAYTDGITFDLDNDTIILNNFDNTLPQLYYFNPMMAGLGGAVSPAADPPTVITVTAAGGKYFMDGVEQGFVDLDPGTTYVFDVSDGSMGSAIRWRSQRPRTDTHTVVIGAEYWTPTTCVGGDGTITLTVDADTPALYYYCEAHSAMGGMAALEAPATGVVPPTPTGGLVLDFEGFPDNGDGTFALADSEFPSYGGVGRGLVTVTEVDGSSRNMLVVENGAGAEWWSGLTLMSEYPGTDLIGTVRIRSRCVCLRIRMVI